MTWYYKDKIFTQEDVGKYRGFIYLITELDTQRMYIGQKVFHNKVAKKPLKGKVNRRLSTKSSDWESYFGSNDELKQRVLERGVSNYHREIIRLCMGKAEMNYHESRELYVRDALLKEEYFNSWISCRVNRNQLKSLM